MRFDFNEGLELFSDQLSVRGEVPIGSVGYLSMIPISVLLRGEGVAS